MIGSSSLRVIFWVLFVILHSVEAFALGPTDRAFELKATAPFRGTPVSLSWDSRFAVGVTSLKRLKGNYSYLPDARLLRIWSVETPAKKGEKPGFKFGKPQDWFTTKPQVTLIQPSAKSLESVSLSRLQAVNLTPMRLKNNLPNPYRSNCQGAKSPLGECLTYKVRIYLSNIDLCEDYIKKGEQCSYFQNTPNQLGYIRATVVIKSINNEIMLKRLDSDFNPINYKAKEKSLAIEGIEPSLTLDGRLLFFQSRTPARHIYFSWNMSPEKSDIWEAPRPMSELYRLRNRVVERNKGLSLSDLYGIARQPLRFQNGNRITSPVGAYPWIDHAGDNLFFTTVMNKRHGSLRAGYSVVGLDTKGQLQHLDGGVNADRYSFRRLMLGALGRVPGHWNQADRSLVDGRIRPDAYGFVMPSSRSYFEVSLENSSRDKHLVHIPGNEVVLPGSWSLQNSKPGEWFYKEGFTQDVSGKFRMAKMVGDVRYSERKEFCPKSFEKWEGCDYQNDRLYREQIRFLGKFLSFKKLGYISIPREPWISSNPQKKLSLAGDVSVSFALRIQARGSKPQQLIGDLPALTLQGSQKLKFKFGSVEYLSPKLEKQKWYHFTLVNLQHLNRFHVYLNGVRVFTHESFIEGLDNWQKRKSFDVGLLEKSKWTIDIDEFDVSSPALSRQEVERQANSLFVVPKGKAPPENLVALGKKLFHSNKISASGLVSCASCHIPSKSFQDNRPLSKGVTGALTLRNTPSLKALFAYENYFWDQRSNSVQGAVSEVLENRREVRANEESLNRALLSVGGGAETPSKRKKSSQEKVSRYISAFLQAEFIFGQPKTFFHFDQLSFSERIGYEVFRGKGKCGTCHGLPAFTNNNSFVSVMNRESLSLRVPSLFGVAKSGPYFSLGNAESLEEVIAAYDRPKAKASRYRPLGLTEQEKKSLKAFLESLSYEKRAK